MKRHLVPTLLLLSAILILPVGIYPSRADSLGVALVARGGSVNVRSLDAWDISPANSW